MSDECVHPDVAVEDYDFGRDPETGYYDAGTRFKCRDCGEEFTEAEWEREQESIGEPRIGVSFASLGMDLLIVDIVEGKVFYIARHGRYKSPIRSLTVEQWRTSWADGLITRPPKEKRP